MAGPVRALIADDETIVRLDIKAMLESVGLEICGQAADGEETVRRALELHPDVIVLDAAMPRLDGVEAARRILAVRPVPIVMLTGYDYGDLISRALDAGVAAYVVKPFQERALLEAVATVLRGGHTKDMLFPVARQIHILSRTWRLVAGDIIYTGTPAGVGPLASGDRLTLSAAGLGRFEWRCQ